MFRRLSDREAGITSEEVPFEGIPGHLEPHLKEWIRSYVPEDVVPEVALRLRLTWNSGMYPLGLVSNLGQGVRTFEEEMLDVLDALVYYAFEYWPSSAAGDPRKVLDRILAQGGSVWSVELFEESEKVRGRLVRRVSDAQRDQFRAVASADDLASEHLRSAWIHQYGVSPDPAQASWEAVKALEVLSAPLITPNNSKATLGSVVGQLRNLMPSYPDERSLPSIVLAIMDVIATVHGPHRHGVNEAAPSQAQPLALEDSELILNLAIAGVVAFRNGSMRNA